MDKAYLVQSKEDEEKLAHYETLAYAARACRITSTHGNEPATVIGKTFMYAGDPEALRQGRFDRKLWERQMGRALPSRMNAARKSESDS